MKRTISTLAVALLGLAVTASAAEAKPTVAVLGIEVIDSGHGVGQRATQLAKWLTQGLRHEASMGKPYRLAPNSNKELLEMKLLSDCADEGLDCMASIGKDLGAAHLLYGRIEQRAHGYQVSLKLLDVHTHKMERTTSDLIPVQEANKAGMRSWAETLYGRLTGQPTHAPLVIHTNANTGTVAIDGHMESNLTAGTAQIKGLSDGEHEVSISADGFAPYTKTVTISADHPTALNVVLSKAGGGAPVRHGHGYRVAFWSSLVASGVAGAAWTVTGLQVRYSIKNDQLAALRELQKTDQTRDYSGSDACAVATEAANAGVQGAQAAVDACNRGESRATLANIFMAATIVGVIASSYFYYKGYKDSGSEGSEHHPDGAATVRVAPALGPKFIGAGLAIEF